MTNFLNASIFMGNVASAQQPLELVAIRGDHPNFSFDPKPVVCTTTSYGGNTAKTITLTTVWWKILIVDATKIHLSKFQ